MTPAWNMPLNAGTAAPYGVQVSPASRHLAALMAMAEAMAQEEYEQGPGRKAAAALAAGEICCSEEVKKERKKKSAYITRYRQKHYESLLEQAVQKSERELAAQAQERARFAAECARLRREYAALMQQQQQQQAAAAAATAAAAAAAAAAAQQQELPSIQEQMPLVKAEVAVESQMVPATAPMDVTMEAADVTQQQNERLAAYPFSSKLDNAFDKFYLSEDEQAAIQEYFSGNCASEAA